MNKKAQASLAILAILLIVVFVGGSVFGGYLIGFLDDIGLASLAGYDIVYKQNWGHICCVQEFDYDISIPNSFNTIKTFNCDSYTNQCEYIVSPGEGYGIAGGKYSINGGFQISFSTRSTQTILVPYGSSITFTPDLDGFWNWFGEDSRVTLNVLYRAKSFYIKGQENGRIYRQESCILNSDLKSRVLVDGLNELQKTGANSCQNYMIDFIQTATQTYTYGGQEVVCQARQLYTLDNMVFKDGQSRKVQGSQIASVGCCPSESNCDANTFKFVVNNVRECTYSSECANGGNPVAVTGTSYVTFGCSNGNCVQSSQQFVECTNNAVCIAKYGSNSVCDLNPSNWGKCKDNSQFIGYCGDNKCESLIGETATSCPDDCSPGVTNKWAWLVVLLILVLVFFVGRYVLKIW